MIASPLFKGLESRLFRLLFSCAYINEAAAKTKTEFIIFFMAVRGVMAVQFSMIADKKLLETGMAPL